MSKKTRCLLARVEAENESTCGAPSHICLPVTVSDVDEWLHGFRMLTLTKDQFRGAAVEKIIAHGDSVFGDLSDELTEKFDLTFDTEGEVIAEIDLESDTDFEVVDAQSYSIEFDSSGVDWSGKYDGNKASFWAPWRRVVDLALHVSPADVSETAKAVARGIIKTKKVDRLSILADALQESDFRWSDELLFFLRRTDSGFSLLRTDGFRKLAGLRPLPR